MNLLRAYLPVSESFGKNYYFFLIKFNSIGFASHLRGLTAG